MRYRVLASDYDGTIAHHGHVDEPTLAALDKIVASGRKLILVTGRELEELIGIFPGISKFECVVAENGGFLYYPATRETKLLAPAPVIRFVDLLRERGVAPLSVGRTIVATWEPFENVVLNTIRDLGLELQVIFNKGAVMVLPAGVNKASGLAAALKEMGLSPHNVVGVGDAENDHAFLALCECSVAVANALPTLKERVDLNMRRDHGAGVTDLIEEMVNGDLKDRRDRLERHHLLLGKRDDDREETIPPYGSSLLVAGPSASGKSTTTTAFMERLAEKAYQFCVIDPEGDYGTLSIAVNLGNSERGPSIEEVLEVLKSPDQNVVVNLVGLPLADRPHFFRDLLPRLQELRARTGRPHWLIIDEVHHLMPKSWEPASLTVPQILDQVLLVTVHPDEVAPAVLAGINTVLAVGQAAQDTMDRFCKSVKEPAPRVPDVELQPGEVMFWRRGGEQPFRVKILPGRTERRRHNRKYAEGELPPERSFFFRGPENKLNLRAQNLFLFMQIAEGVDDETWLHHLRQGDYSKWFREGLKDEKLAEDTQVIERDEGQGAGESRAEVRKAIERHYTLPTSTT